MPPSGACASQDHVVIGCCLKSKGTSSDFIVCLFMTLTSPSPRFGLERVLASVTTWISLTILHTSPAVSADPQESFALIRLLWASACRDPSEELWILSLSTNISDAHREYLRRGGGAPIAGPLETPKSARQSSYLISAETSVRACACSCDGPSLHPRASLLPGLRLGLQQPGQANWLAAPIERQNGMSSGPSHGVEPCDYACVTAPSTGFCMLQAMVMPRQSHGLKDKIMEYILGL